MKKVLSLVAILCMALVLLAGCDLLFTQPTETPCEHAWVDATCTAPKTCSLCGATDGEALGHNAIEVFGQAPTCTEPGQTNLVYCDVCDQNLSEAQEIAPLGHTEETIAGTPATCTEPGMSDGKKCTVCGVTTVEQTVIDALGHTLGADDGDVTTPVKCTNEGCDEILVAAKEAITLTIPAFENGAVIADKLNYAIGDTVKLTINPDWGYAQKLYVDGEPLMLDWNNNVYTFVAEKDTYVISGSFEPALDMAAGDVTRWDYINQGHGIVTTYYPNNNDAWWFKINGDYSAFSIIAKNYREVANSYENGPDGGWRIALFMQLDNGNYYAFSMWIDTNHKYAYNHFGGKIAGDKDSVTTWGGAWHDLVVTNAEATAALNGDGAEFKLERIDGNKIRVTFGGVELETYEIPGVTADNKVVSVGLHHWGNKGSYVDIPFELTSSCQHTWVDATCTAPKTCSTCKVTIGEKIDHTYTNYVSDGNATCTADGTKTGTCVCGAKNTIADAGSKVAHTEETVPGKDATCTETGLTDGKKCSVCGVTTVEQEIILAKDHKDDDNNYKCDTCDTILCTDHVEEVVAGKAATCTESGLTEGKRCANCGSIILAQEIIPATGHKAGEDDGNCETAVKCVNKDCDEILIAALTHAPAADDGDVTTAVKCTNEGCAEILVPAKEAITLTIPTFANGTVTQDKMNYAVGDTVILTVAPNKDYAQKLYINGDPILVDTNSKYSFVAEEGKTYDITGEFVYVKGAWYWTAEYIVLNQAHGVFHSPVPSGGEKNGELVPTADQYAGGKVLFKDPSGGTKQDYAIVLKMHFSDGQKAEVRIVNKDGKGHYMVQSMSGMLGSWKWYYDLNDEENAAVANGEGVWFELVREGTDIKIKVNGSVKTRNDVTVNVPVDVVLNQFKITTYNFSYAIDVHYVFTKACDHTWVDATCTAPKTCSACNVTVGEKLAHTYTDYVSNNDATCTADGTKTGACVCGEKNIITDEGSALGHKEETIAGKAATCTETGLTDGKKCSACGVTTVEQSEIPANGHKDDNGDYICDVCEANLCTDHIEETVAGKAATCTEDGLTDGKKCSICGSIILSQEVIPAKGHTANADDGNCATAVVCANGCGYIFVGAMNHDPEADDGDVTTAVQCTNEGCNQILVPAKEAITLTIPTFENGAVTADKKNYAIGDTVTLTIAPAGGYFQKLYINDEPLLLDWKTKVYSFVAEKDTYVIDGSFEPTLEVYAGDWGRWDNANQAHGLLSAYYPSNNDAWWFKIKGDYNSFAINAKNYREIANSYEGGPDGGWRIALYMQLDNGNYYAFSMWIDAGQKYAYNHYGGKIAGEKDSVTTWGGAWRELAVVNPEATAALNGNGAEFKLERIDGNHIQVTFGGVVLETYEIPGVTADNKVVSVGLHHWGNKGARVEIPFALTVPTVEEEPPVTDGDVTLNIGEFANGTVTADKDSYKVGETVTLTVSPAKDYAQKLYINGAPILVDPSSKYSFVVEAGKTYDITGEFVYVKGDWFWTAEYIVLNQAHGVFHSPKPAGGEKNGELVPTADKCYGGKVLVTDPSKGSKKDYAIVLKMVFSDGTKAEVRLVNKEGTGTYMVQSMSGLLGSWKWYYDLSAEENAAVANGEGVWFELVREGTNIKITLNGSVKTRGDITVNVPEDVVLNQFKVTTYNFGYEVDVPYEFYMTE